MTKFYRDIEFQRRALFVAGNVAACALIIFAIVLPIFAFFSDRDSRIADQRQLLARLTGIAAQAAKVQVIVSDTKSRVPRGEFLSGSDDNVISADLQTRLKAITESAGAHSRAVQALVPKVRDEVRYTGSRIEISGPLKSIYRAVYAIESAKPYLFVTAASIKMIGSENGRGNLEEPTLQAQLDVFGATRVEEHTP